MISFKAAQKIITKRASLFQVDHRDSSKSKTSRDEGLKLFRSKNFEKALDKFSEAMLLAPVNVSRQNGSLEGLWVYRQLKNSSEAVYGRVISIGVNPYGLY